MMEMHPTTQISGTGTRITTPPAAKAADAAMYTAKRNRAGLVFAE